MIAREKDLYIERNESRKEISLLQRARRMKICVNSIGLLPPIKEDLGFNVFFSMAETASRRRFGCSDDHKVGL